MSFVNCLNIVEILIFHKLIKKYTFSLIHSDLWGPSKTSNITCSKWFISCIDDDHTRICWVNLLKEKSKVKEILKSFNVMINT